MDLPTEDACIVELAHLFEDLQVRIAKANCESLITQRTIKVRFSDFETTTAASKGSRIALADYVALFKAAWARHRKPVRLIGVGVALTTPAPDSQLALFN